MELSLFQKVEVATAISNVVEVDGTGAVLIPTVIVNAAAFAESAVVANTAVVVVGAAGSVAVTS